MSKLQPEILTKALNWAIDTEYQNQITDIFKDKKFFEPMTYEEDDRITQREKLNTRLLKLLKEAKKIKPLSESFNDIFLWCAMSMPIWIYNDNMSTKMAVNF
jgi:hypothetical protein